MWGRLATSGGFRPRFGFDLLILVIGTEYSVDRREYGQSMSMVYGRAEKYGESRVECRCKWLLA